MADKQTRTCASTEHCASCDARHLAACFRTAGDDVQIEDFAQIVGMQVQAIASALAELAVAGLTASEVRHGHA